MQRLRDNPQCADQELESISASVYYNGADGWFDVWDDPVLQNDLLRFGIPIIPVHTGRATAQQLREQLGGQRVLR